MSDQNQSAGEQSGGGGNSGGNSGGGGRKRKRYFRNRRRGRKPQGDKPATSNEEEAAGARSRGGRRSPAKAKPRNPDANLDPVKRARRDRRRRKRSGDRSGEHGGERRGDAGRAAEAAPEPMPDLEIEPKRVFVYTHVLRPALRDAYEYRAEHFSQTGRTLDDFRIDLSPILIFPDGDLDAEPIIDLHIGRGDEAGEMAEDADWDDDEPLG
ncbi:MAG: hypothetical protein WDZ49_06890, partial [Litorilinea sp.]